MTDDDMRTGRTDKYRCRYCGLDLPPVPALAAQHYWQGHYDEPAHQEVVRELYGDLDH